MFPFFTNLPACLIGMEACGSARYWANQLQVLGHTVKLIAPSLGNNAVTYYSEQLFREAGAIQKVRSKVA